MLWAVGAASALPIEGPAEHSLKNACGPMAAFVACKWAGVQCTLGEVVAACEWNEGQPSEVRALLLGLKRLAVPCSLARLNQEQLRTFLVEPNVAAILLVGRDRDRPDHLLTAIGVRGERTLVIDYPRGVREMLLDSRLEGWNGWSILVANPAKGQSILEAFLQPLRNREFRLKTCLYAASSVSIAAGLALVWRRRWRVPSDKRRLAKDS